ncbi:lycopene cyclase domain-containing protein [Arthrobacter sp. 35W]|uniref:lycopene cyclase domain-containing protein n=1 Tax=Arthrobacter sp. 35W TaxID=1132441 RepID=UPI00041D5AA0|nr:lycopene cyclase domain-containing protein [Arthrobacter sp. 35W]
MNLLYLGVLLASLAGMVLLDWRHALFFWAAPVRAAVVMAASLAFFLSWDLAGIGLGIFQRGHPGAQSGVLVAPQLPLEEVFFLVFLGYLAMNIFLLASRRLATGRFAPPGAAPADHRTHASTPGASGRAGRRSRP